MTVETRIREVAEDFDRTFANDDAPAVAQVYRARRRRRARRTATTSLLLAATVVVGFALTPRGARNNSVRVAGAAAPTRIVAEDATAANGNWAGPLVELDGNGNSVRELLSQKELGLYVQLAVRDDGSVVWSNMEDGRSVTTVRLLGDPAVARRLDDGSKWALAPDGHTLAFTRAHAGGSTLELTDLFSTDSHVLVDSSTLRDGAGGRSFEDVAFSPDGTKIAVTSYVTRNPPITFGQGPTMQSYSARAELIVLDAETGAVESRTPLPDLMYVNPIAWLGNDRVVTTDWPMRGVQQSPPAPTEPDSNLLLIDPSAGAVTTVQHFHGLAVVGSNDASGEHVLVSTPTGLADLQLDGSLHPLPSTHRYEPAAW